MRFTVAPVSTRAAGMGTSWTSTSTLIIGTEYSESESDSTTEASRALTLSFRIRELGEGPWLALVDLVEADEDILMDERGADEREP